MTANSERYTLVRQRIGGSLGEFSPLSPMFESPWNFIETIVPSDTWPLLSDVDILLAYATLAAYTLIKARVPADRVLAALATIPELRGRASQRAVRSMLAGLIQSEMTPHLGVQPIDAFLSRFTPRNTHPRLIELVILIAKLYGYFGVDRYGLDQLIAETLSETVDTARSHFSRTERVVLQADPDKGELRLLLPEGDAKGKLAAERLTESIRTLIANNRELILVFGLKYEASRVSVVCITRPTSDQVNPFASLLVPVRAVPPYRGLDPFTLETRHLFFGRDDEVRTFGEDLLCHRITVMKGASGIGKTSLILAGLVQHLIFQHHLPVVVTAQYKPNYNFPLAEVMVSTALSSIAKVFPSMRVPEVRDSRDDLRGVCQYVSSAMARMIPDERPRIIFIVDQMEAFLLSSTMEGKQRFFDRVIECDLDYTLDVGFLFAIRSEFFELLEAHKGSLIDLYAHVRSLAPLSRQDVIDALEKPSRICNVELELGLVNRIVDDLMISELPVVTPQIQIVVTTLHDIMRSEHMTEMTHELYDQLGGCQGILTTFLNRELDTFPPSERDLVKRVLTEMTTGSGTAATVSVPELALMCASAEEVISKIMDQLVRRSWLIRRTDATTQGQPTFKLTHEYLISAIHSWLEPDARIVRRLRQHLGLLYRSWDESGRNDLFLMTRTQLREFEGQLSVISVPQRQVAYVMQSSLFEPGMDDILFEAVSLLNEDTLLGDVILTGLSSIDADRCGRAKRVAALVVDRITTSIWNALPRLPWHARQAAIEILVHSTSRASLVETGLYSRDWRVYSAAQRLRQRDTPQA